MRSIQLRTRTGVTILIADGKTKRKIRLFNVLQTAARHYTAEPTLVDHNADVARNRRTKISVQTDGLNGSVLRKKKIK